MRRIIVSIVLVLVSVMCPVSALAVDNPTTSSVRDVLRLPQNGEMSMTGYLGRKIDLCIGNRVKPQDIEHLVEPFRHRNERNLWQTEFWGKWITSAQWAFRYNGDPEIKAILETATQKLIETQTSDGYIGNYHNDAHLQNWDIWGRKYCLLGLLGHYDITGDTAALDSACKLADHLMTEVGPGKADIVMTGNHRGMASSSVLEPMVLLYKRTGDKRYLDFAEYIVSQWRFHGDRN